MLSLAGVFPPLPTSFDHQEELLTERMTENIARLNACELSGYLVLGSNGESVHLGTKEKQQVFESCRAAIPSSRLMLAGTGAQSTRETISLTRLAARCGADAALVLNPSYYKGQMSQEVLLRHYFAVADSAEIPLIIYNMPANSALDMDAATLTELSRHPNIIGLKDSGGNLTKMVQIMADAEEDFQVLAGSAGFFLPALSIGACGGILALANLAPQLCLSIFSSFQQGAHNQAADLQKKVIRLNTMVTRGWGVPALKAAMDYIGLYGGPGRKPLPELNDAHKDELFSEITAVIPSDHFWSQ